MRIVAVRAEHAVAHAGAAGKVGHRNALQPQGPRRQQVKAAVPGEIVDAGRGLEEYDGRTC